MSRKEGGLLQSSNVEGAGIPREQYPTTRFKGTYYGGVDVHYIFGVEVCARSLQHWKQVNMLTADVDCNDSVIRIKVLPVSFKSLPGEQMDGDCVSGESLEHKDIELLYFPLRQLSFQKYTCITELHVHAGF